MQTPNDYRTEYKRLELEHMMAAGRPNPAVTASRQKAHEQVVNLMVSYLDALDIAKKEDNAGKEFTFEQALKWIGLVDEISYLNLASDALFGAGPIKAGIDKGAKFLANATGKPKLQKGTDTALQLHGIAARVSAPLSWIDKISGHHIAVPLGVKTTLSPSLSNLLAQLSNWTGGAKFIQICGYIGVASQTFAHLTAALSVALAFNKISGILHIVEDYADECSCCEQAEKISRIWMGDTANFAAGLNPAMLPMIAWPTLHKKAHWLANKLRDSRTHLAPFHLAETLWRGAQLFSPGHTRYTQPALSTSTLPDTGGRCPVALIAIATLFGNGDPAKGVKDAVAAIHIKDSTLAANKIKGKIR